MGVLQSLLDDSDPTIRKATREAIDKAVSDKWLQYQLGFAALSINYPDVSTWGSRMMARSGKGNIGPVYEKPITLQNQGAYHDWEQLIEVVSDTPAQFRKDLERQLYRNEELVAIITEYPPEVNRRHVANWVPFGGRHIVQWCHVRTIVRKKQAD
jgi:hypothetical protein